MKHTEKVYKLQRVSMHEQDILSPERNKTANLNPIPRKIFFRNEDTIQIFSDIQNGKNLSPAEKSLETLKEVFQAEGNDTRWKYGSTQRNEELWKR